MPGDGKAESKRKRLLCDSDLDGFGFRTGYRSALDISFREVILRTIPEGVKLTVWIKQIVIEWDRMCRGEVERAEIDRIVNELVDEQASEQALKIQRLEFRLAEMEKVIRPGKIISGGVGSKIVTVIGDAEDEEADEKIDSLINAF